MKILNSNKNFEIIVGRNNDAEVYFKGIKMGNILNFKFEVDADAIISTFTLKFALTNEDIIRLK